MLQENQGKIFKSKELLDIHGNQGTVVVVVVVALRGVMNDMADGSNNSI